MPSQFVYTGLEALEKKLKKMAHLDPTPLLLEWRSILEQDNRRGLMLGLDGYGVPLKKLLSKRKGKYKGATGPPLLPFYETSRVISRFRTAHGHDGDRYFAMGAWEDVLSKDGVAFLPFHFRGEGVLPIRDLAHVRPWGVTQAQVALRVWVRTQYRAA